ncbi:hypothetical protein SAMN04488007_2908 [Maribacter aquivivus]|uniref:Uncharacterized protein n=2 Tax=Maribacter aquivivus TaxID=228958 RepID=A0A1M6S0G5_9FLAO|nr:hypothetical protein SAMN04488007_2908 [Maribacter aquivivus]
MYSSRILSLIMKKQFLFSIFVFISMQLFAQDTLVFSQENSSMFSNRYFLNPESKTFEHKYNTDDGQLWYGEGNYEIKRNRLFLRFGDSEKAIKSDNQITKIYDRVNKTDTLIVQIIDTQEDFAFVHIKYNEEYFYGDLDNGLVKIPKSKFKDIENPIVQTSLQGSLISIELTEISELNFIKITGIDINTIYHFESNFKRNLSFKKNKLKSKDFYNTSKKKKVIFIVEE